MSTSNARHYYTKLFFSIFVAGEACSDLVDFCESSPCPENAICASEPLVGFNCTCVPGFYGRLLTHVSRKWPNFVLQREETTQIFMHLMYLHVHVHVHVHANTCKRKYNFQVNCVTWLTSVCTSHVATMRHVTIWLTPSTARALKTFTVRKIWHW